VMQLTSSRQCLVEYCVMVYCVDGSNLKSCSELYFQCVCMCVCVGVYVCVCWCAYLHACMSELCHGMRRLVGIPVVGVCELHVSCVALAGMSSLLVC